MVFHGEEQVWGEVGRLGRDGEGQWGAWGVGVDAPGAYGTGRDVGMCGVWWGDTGYLASPMVLCGGDGGPWCVMVNSAIVWDSPLLGSRLWGVMGHLGE